MEIWKEIKGYEGLYKVSSLGRVMSMPKIVLINGYLCELRGGFILKHQYKDSGYPYVVLTKGLNDKTNKHKNEKKFCVHRLVAEAFISNPENKPYIDHINGDRQDPKVDNLRWVTQKENMNNPITKENMHTGHMGQKQLNRTKFHWKMINNKRVYY